MFFMPPLPPVTKWLMLICTAVFCVQALNLMPLGILALWPLGTGNFMPWQLLTYAFLHGDFMHLFFNMFGLWMFGAEMERLWGQYRYGYFLLASVLTAAATQLVITYLMGSYAPTIGISGGIFGLLLAFGMLFPNRTIMPLFPPIPMKARTFVAVFGGIELLMGLARSNGGVAHFAHLGGMLGGWLMIRYWRGQAPFSRKRR